MVLAVVLWQIFSRSFNLVEDSIIGFWFNLIVSFRLVLLLELMLPLHFDVWAGKGEESKGNDIC